MAFVTRDSSSAFVGVLRAVIRALYVRGLIVVERVRSESRRSLRVCSVFSSGRFGVAGAGCWWLAFVLVAWGLEGSVIWGYFIWMVRGLF